MIMVLLKLNCHISVGLSLSLIVKFHSYVSMLSLLLHSILQFVWFPSAVLFMYIGVSV